MKRFETILVGAGLDDRDSATLRHAAWFARAAESKAIYVAHVTPTFDFPPALSQDSPASLVPVDEEIEERLRAAVASQRASFAPGACVREVVRQGSLLPELLRLAAQKSADLFCLGRRQPPHDDPLSESAMRLVHKVPCSVLVVPPGVEPRYDRLLVPVDFSDHSREALDVACGIARATPGGTLVVQHTYEVPLGWHKSGHSYEECAAIMRHNAQTRWAEFSVGLDFRGVPWSVRFDLGDSVPKTILNVAEEIDARLVVVGSHGRTKPAGFLLGHVADTVCARTARPVLCVKRKGEVVTFLHALLQFLQFENE